MSNKKFSISFKGKGYYIALILCAAAIGISGYLYYKNANEPEQNLQLPASATDPAVNADVQTGATSGDTPLQPGDPSPTQGQKPGRITRPVSGQVIVEHVLDALCYNQTTRDWRVHDGIDIAAEAGTDVVAAADGTVYTVYNDDTMGTTVVIRHDAGYVTRYASLSTDVAVSAGDIVAAGQVIGKVGNTALLETAIGDHLHFSVSCNGEAVDPNDFLSQS